MKVRVRCAAGRTAIVGMPRFVTKVRKLGGIMRILQEERSRSFNKVENKVVEQGDV